jgi:hypothetical protein
MTRKNFYLQIGSVLFLFLMLGLGACRKDEHVFDQSPDTRLNDALKKYQSALSGSPAGWNGTLRLKNGGTYQFHFRFNDSNRVFMYADINQETASTRRESSYRLKALQTPALLFDTYSYLHILSDPDASVNGGTYGQGLSSDFEFSLDSLIADTILLTGRVNGTKLTLVKSTQQDFNAWQNGNWAAAMTAFGNINKILNYFKRVTINGTTYEIRPNLDARTITFIWVDNTGTSHEFTTYFSYSSTGIVLATPLDTGSQPITGLEVVSWDATNFLLTVKVNGTATTIAGAIQPLKADLTAPKRWWDAATAADTYWISFDGFHANGVDDAFGIKTLPRYYYLIYWPNYAAGSNDLFAPVFLNAAGNGLELLYGAAPAKPQFTADGRAIFTLLGNYGTYPSSGPARLSRNQLLIPQGYYFVQTGATSFDMVSAVDAKTWISWQF